MLLADEQKRRVNDALNQLSEEMRLVVHLVYFEGLAPEEAANVLKKNRKQVYNLLYRAKTALRTILAEGGELSQ
jgi:RNA polymerase sigma-70 factor (ECF subfamily)